MTDQNDAAQPDENLLDYAMAIAHERELDVTGHKHDSEGAVRRFKAAVERALLSKLRAEGVQAGGTADEARETIAAGLQDSAYCAGLQRGFMLGDHGDHEGLRKALESRDGYVKTIKDARAALASTPVAGEARPLDWQNAQRIAELPEVDEALANFCDDSTLDNAVGLVLAVLGAAPQASEAVRILFPAHLRKMWSGGEVQAWLDEHQGIMPPKATAKGSLERYRKWQAERDEAFAAGVKAAADLVKKMVDDYDTDHGSTDPETGSREYPGEGATWVCEMQELEESIRALSAQPGAQHPKQHNDGDADNG